MINTPIASSTKGQMVLNNSIISNSLTAAATNTQAPMGGVINAIVMFSVTTIPKWIGSIPANVATGKNIGVRSISAETSSMNMPVIKVMAESMNNTKIGLS